MLFKLKYNTYTKYWLAIVSIFSGYFVILLISKFSVYRQFGTACIFKQTTGIPCSGCGMGRATLMLLDGNVGASFSANILCIPFTLAIVFALIWMFYDIVRKKETFFLSIKKEIGMPYKILIFGILMASWVANIARDI